MTIADLLRREAEGNGESSWDAGRLDVADSQARLMLLEACGMGASSSRIDRFKNAVEIICRDDGPELGNDLEALALFAEWASTSEAAREAWKRLNARHGTFLETVDDAVKHVRSAAFALGVAVGARMGR